MPRSAALPISQLFQIKAVCDDCGRRHVWDQHEIARQQLRRGLATPEELGSYYACRHCVELGGEGKNVSVRLISRGGVVTEVQRDLRPLSVLTSALACCPNCGREVRFGEPELAEMPASLTVHDLWQRAVCEPCKEAGAPRPRMTLEVMPPMPQPGAKPPEEVRWSRKQVFGEDRSSPFPNLPRSRLMRDPNIEPVRQAMAGGSRE